MTDVLVVGAVISRDGLILCARKGGSGPLAGLWEFPGGKVEPGETDEVALAREIGEELGCTITVGAKIVSTRHHYDFATIVLTTYHCSLVGADPQPSEHAALRWLPAYKLGELKWAPADLLTVTHLTARPDLL